MSRPRRLTVVLLLNLSMVAALLVTGVAARSLAVFAAGADYLADAAAIGVSLLAIWLAARPRGYPQGPAIAALVNAGWLLIANAVITVAAVWHLAAGTSHVDGLPVLVTSAVAAVVMLAGALVLGGDDDDDDYRGESLNVRAILLDTAADAAAATGVAASGAVILATGGWYWLDPGAALVISVIVGWHSISLIRAAIEALRSP